MFEGFTEPEPFARGHVQKDLCCVLVAPLFFDLLSESFFFADEFLLELADFYIKVAVFLSFFLVILIDIVDKQFFYLSQCLRVNVFGLTDFEVNFFEVLHGVHSEGLVDSFEVAFDRNVHNLFDFIVLDLIVDNILDTLVLYIDKGIIFDGGLTGLEIVFDVIEYELYGFDIVL